MIDAKAVFIQIQAWRYSPQWRVYYGGSKRKYWIFMGIWTLLSVSCMVIGGILERARSSGGLPFVLRGLLLLTLGIFNAKKTYVSTRDILVLLPEGVVHRFSGSFSEAVFIRFSEIESLRLSHQSAGDSGLVEQGGQMIDTKTDGWLLLKIFLRKGPSLTWPLHQISPDPALIGNAIIAAFEQSCQQQPGEK
jgi:hypothetical protein